MTANIPQKNPLGDLIQGRETCAERGPLGDRILDPIANRRGLRGDPGRDLTESRGQRGHLRGVESLRGRPAGVRGLTDVETDGLIEKNIGSHRC